MNVLSLFDGMACGRIALEKAGIHVDKYFSSEIDKYAMQIAKKNYPDIIHVGDVQDVMYPETFDGHKIDLIIGGSPCQGFSFAGQRLNFDDPRSKLFFEYARLVKECKPKYFLLENVRMKQESQDVITEMLGVEPVAINSRLVSAQNRYRLYWTNIPFEGQPEDKGLLLRDILEYDPDNYTIMSDKFTTRNKDAGCLVDATKLKASNLSAMEYVKNGRQGDYIACDTDGKPTENGLILVGHAKLNGHDCIKRVYHPDGKAPTLNACTGGNREPKVACGASRGRYLVEGKRMDGKMKTSGLTTQMLEVRSDDKTNTLTTVLKDNLVTEGLEKGSRQPIQECIGKWRKLTPLECERLQTVPDGYTEGVSNTQRYKMLGNGWTADVIAHIFRGLLST